MRDPYAVLGLDPSANDAEIKRAFRMRAKALHPDNNPDDPLAEAAFRDLTEAYATLTDPTLRAIIDQAQPPDADTDVEDEPRSRARSFFDLDREDLRQTIMPEKRESEPIRVADPDFPYKESWQLDQGEAAVEPPPPHWPEEPWTAMEAAGLNPDLAEKEREALREETSEGPDIFDELYASPDLGRKRHQAARPEALDQHYTITIPFMLAARGGYQRLLLAGDRDIEVPIPAGIEEGTILKAGGMGAPNPAGGRPGDALLRVQISPHPLFRRKGSTVFVSVPISLDEAVLGGSLKVPTLEGLVRVRLPPDLGAKAKLKLSGHGVPLDPGNPLAGKGDQILELELALPASPDQRLRSFLQSWRPTRSPREENGFDELVEHIAGEPLEPDPIEAAPE